MTAEAGRWWVRYVSTQNPSSARWLGPTANATILAQAMHQAGEIEETEMAECARALQMNANARGAGPPGG